MLRARAVVAGVLVSVFLVPASAAVAQESSTTTSSTTSTTAPPSSTSTSSAPGPSNGATTIPKPDPDAFAVLANQVSQNQQMLTQLSAQVDQATQRLTALGSEIDANQQKLDAQRKQLEDSRASQQEEKDRLENAKQALEALTAHQKKLLDQSGAIPVMGDAELTPAEVTGWFESRNVKYRLSGGISIGDLVQMYFEEGKAEHLRPELAFAQAIIETGSFGNALDNNYAGIGACDSCQGEPAFPSPRDGVRGQIQLLRNYADPASRAANLANPPSPTIYGHDPVAAANGYDTFFAKGRTPTWNVMGNGNWATDPGYAQKVLTVYFQMVSFAAKHS